MLRAAVSLSLLRRILRFSTTGRPGALGACHMASWQLPRLDFHQRADDTFRAHQRVARRTGNIGWLRVWARFSFRSGDGSARR